MRAPERLYARQVQQVCLDVCQDIVDEIQRSPLTPEETHALERGYRAIEAGDGAEIVTNVDYWAFQEFGTRDMAPNPHVRPAIEFVRRRRLG